MPALPTKEDDLAKLLGGAGFRYEDTSLERKPAPLVDAGYGAPPAITPPASLLHPDLGTLLSKGRAAPATISPVPSPQISAEDAERMRNEEQAAHSGLAVQAQNAYDRKQSGEAPPKPLVFAKPPEQGATPAGTTTPGTKPGGGAPAKDPYADYIASMRAEQDAQRGVVRANEEIEQDAGIFGGIKERAYGQQVRDVMARAEEQDREAHRRMAEVGEASRRAADMKEDPDRWWHSQGTADKARLILASAFGGLAAGLKGGPNTALQHINGLIDKDIAAQRQQIEAKRGRVADLRGSLAEMYRRFGNMDQAEAGARLLHLQQLDAEAQEYTASSRSDLVRAQGEAIVQHLGTEIEAQRAKLAAAGRGEDPRAAIVKRTQELRDKAAANGVDMSIDEARDQATAEILRTSGTKPQGYAKPTKGAAEDAGAMLTSANAAPPRATNFLNHPVDYLEAKLSRILPGTEGAKAARAQQYANIPVHGFAHKAYGIRTPEGQAEVMGPVMIQPGDSEERIREKMAARAALAGKGGGAAPEPLPEDFEEEAP